MLSGQASVEYLSVVSVSLAFVFLISPLIISQHSVSEKLSSALSFKHYAESIASEVGFVCSLGVGSSSSVSTNHYLIAEYSGITARFSDSNGNSKAYAFNCQVSGDRDLGLHLRVEKTPFGVKLTNQ